MSSKLASYEYDDLGRLVGVKFPDGAFASYAFDGAGNRTTVIEAPASALSPALAVDSFAKRNNGDTFNAAMLVKLSNGELVGWGDNTNGILANGIATATNQPAQKVLFDPNGPLPPFSATIVEWTFTNANLYVIFSNGWAYSAGQNAYGQLATNEATSIVRPYLKRIEYFVTNGKSVTKVWAGGARNTTDGGGCVYFLCSDYYIYACGANGSGNLGAGGTTNQVVPIACVGLPTTSGSHVVDVAVTMSSTNFSAYALISDGKLFVAGYNGFNQLAIGSSTSNVTGGFVSATQTVGATTPNVSNFVALSANGGYTGTVAGMNALGIDSNGDVWTVGYNSHGELGLGTTTQMNRFTKVTALSNVVKAELGCGPFGAGYAINAAGSFYTWGYNGDNNLFKNSTTSPQSTPAVATFVPGLVAQAFFPKWNLMNSISQMFVLTTSGQLVYCGSANGMLGIANTVNPGAYFYIALPRSLSDGTENIIDIFVHGSSTTQRLFLLTDLGNLYATGSNTDSVCTGGIASDTIAASVSCFKLNLATIDN